MNLLGLKSFSEENQLSLQSSYGSESIYNLNSQFNEKQKR